MAFSDGLSPTNQAVANGAMVYGTGSPRFFPTLMIAGLAMSTENLEPIATAPGA